MPQTEQVGNTEVVSGQVCRQPNWPKWFKRWQASELLPIIPPGAPLDPSADIAPMMLGKIPGRVGADGLWHGFGGKWAEKFTATLDDIKAWHASGASIGMQGRMFPGIDIDVEDAKLVADLRTAAFEAIGPAPIRSRDGTHRELLPYVIADGEKPLRKRRLAFLVNDQKQAVELLGWGQQYVVEGPHPKAGEYRWDKHPCEAGPSGLSKITKAKADAFFAEVVSLLDMFGYPIVVSKDAGNTKRTGLDNPRLHAPSPEAVLELLREYQPESLDHDDYVAHVAAIKAALGPAREDYRGEVLEWSPGVRAEEPDQFLTRWDSIRDSALGWDWLTAQARGAGYRGDAQHDFDDAPKIEAQTSHPSAVIPETPYDRMLGRYVWVKNLGQYNDTEDGSFLDSKNFNAANVDVKPFGSSGQQSAEATFQNAPGARKVATATSQPGKAVILDETNDKGIPVKAVNLWRPSLIQPDLSATTADVAPWLDLVNLLFGTKTPEREHFLRWWAYVLQHPGEKIGHALVIIGGQGVGKDTVLRPLFEAVGLHNVASIDTATLMGQWTHFLKAQIIYAQELITYGRRDLYNTLKPYISAQATRLAVNEKNLRQYYVPNNQNWIVTSNYDNAIALEDDDRRFWVHRALIEEAPSDDYFAKLYAWFEADGTEKVFGWLKHYTLADFNPMAKPPLTAAKRAMLDASQPVAVRWVREQLREGGALAQRRVVTVSELQLCARQDWTAPQQQIGDKQVMAALKAEGFKAAHRVRLGISMKQLWARGLDGSVTAGAMKDLYLKETGGEPSCEAA